MIIKIITINSTTEKKKSARLLDRDNANLQDIKTVTS